MQGESKAESMYLIDYRGPGFLNVDEREGKYEECNSKYFQYNAT
jgi:hypothetical protein